MAPLRRTNMEAFLECTSPRVPVHYHTQKIGASSSSDSAEAKEVRTPRIGLSDVWSACEEWSCFGAGVPLTLEETFGYNVTHYFAPSLSAMQIFTIKPYADDSSSRSSVIAKDGTETKSAEPKSFGDYRHRFLRTDRLGYLYFEYDETTSPYERTPLTYKILELAEKYPGLNSLTSSDLTQYSWISIAWYPIYPVPTIKNNNEFNAAFLTYHSLTPNFSETFGEGDKVNGNGKSKKKTEEVVLTPFAAANYKAIGNVWIMPGTLDKQQIERREQSATSWVDTLGFFHSDLNYFMGHKFFGGCGR